MKYIYLILILPLMALGGYVITLFHNVGTLSASKLEIKDGLIVKDDAPVNGTIRATIEDAEILLRPFLDMVEYNPEWKNLPIGKLPLEDVDFLKKEFKGFAVHADVEDGKLSNSTSVYYDLRASRDKLFGKPIPKNMKYYLGYLFKNQIKLAEANFVNNQLHGSAVLLNPDPAIESAKIVEVNFEENNPKSVKRFHENGELKRVNNYNLFKKEGLQQEFSSTGALTFEANYNKGQKVWQKSYFWKTNQLRHEIKYSASNNRNERHYFPNGDPAVEYLGSSRKEWYSNGTIKSFRSEDTSYFNKPIGKIETYHRSGEVHKIFNYNDTGMLDGPYEIYYASGKVWEKGHYKNGRKNGQMQKWFTNGLPAEDHMMIDGKINGPFVRYYDDGQLWKSFNYDHGKLEGAYKKWWKNGQLAFDCEYENNRMVKCDKWNDQGEKI